MIMEEFVKDALRTEPDLKAYWHAAGRVAQGIAQDSPGTNYLKLRLLHVGMGLATEAGEFMDALKRYVFYGKELDTVNLIEELGDVTWYLRIACDVLGVSLAEVIQKNVDKLRKRFPDKFTEDKAVNRDLEEERAALGIIAPNVAKQEADAKIEWLEDALARCTGRWVAAERECDILRAGRDADLCHIEQAVKERDAWIGDCEQHLNNTGYYRGLLVEIGNLLGYVARRADDGSMSENVLVAKVPKLVHERFERLTNERDAARQEVSKWRCAPIPTKRNLATHAMDTLMEPLIRSHMQDTLVSFASGATGSKVPHLEYIPYAALVSMANRFALGMEKHGTGAWNATQNNHFLSDTDWAVARCVHTIIHAYKEIGIISGYVTDDGDDNAGAILFGGAFLAARREWIAKQKDGNK